MKKSRVSLGVEERKIIMKSLAHFVLNSLDLNDPYPVFTEEVKKALILIWRFKNFSNNRPTRPPFRWKKKIIEELKKIVKEP